MWIDAERRRRSPLKEQHDARRAAAAMRRAANTNIRTLSDVAPRHAAFARAFLRQRHDTVVNRSEREASTARTTVNAPMIRCRHAVRHVIRRFIEGQS
jgi:hypothetical protein